MELEVYGIHTTSVSSILSVKYYCHQAGENRVHKGKPQNTSILFIDHIFHYITCPMVWKYYYDYNAFFFFLTSVRSDFLQSV